MDGCRQLGNGVEEAVQALTERLPGGLQKLRQLLHKGLEGTAALWPPVRAAYRWVKRVARVLANPKDDHTKGSHDESLGRATDQFFFVVRKPK